MEPGALPPYLPTTLHSEVRPEERVPVVNRSNFGHLSSSLSDPSTPPREITSRKIIDGSEDDDLTSERDAMHEFMYSIMSETKKELDKKNIDDFNAELVLWEERFNKNMSYIKDLHYYQGSAYDLLKYLQTNKETFLILFKSALTAEDYEPIVTFLDEEYTSIRLLEPALAVILGPITLFIIRKYDRELNEITKEYEGLLKNSFVGQKRINVLNGKLSKERRSTLKYSGFKFSELMSYQVLPIVIITFLKNRLEYRQIIKIFRLVFTTIKKINNTRGLFQARANEKIWSKNLRTTPTFKHEFTPQFHTYLNEQPLNPEEVKKNIIELAQEYREETGIGAYAEQPDMIRLFEQRQDEFKDKVEELSEQLDELIKSSCNESQSELFNKELKRQGFYFKDLEEAPVSIDEWMLKKEDAEWKRELCKRTVEHHLTIGRLLKNGNTCSLLSKIEIEKRFVTFNIAKNVVDVASNIVQMLLFLPKGFLVLLREILSKIEKNLAIPGLELSFILYPDINLSVEGMISSIVGHFFGYYYKPNEYSLKGYWIDIQKKWNGFIYNIQYALYILMRCIFQVFDKVLQFCMRTKNDPGVETRAYTKISKYLASNRVSYKVVMDNLEASLNELKLKDIKNALNGRVEDWDNLQNIIEGLTEGNYLLFAQDVLDHFKYETGIELSEKSKIVIENKAEESNSEPQHEILEEKSKIQMEIEELYIRGLKEFFHPRPLREEELAGAAG